MCGLRGIQALFSALVSCHFSNASSFWHLGAVHVRGPLHWESVKVEFHLETEHVGVGAELGNGFMQFTIGWLELLACADLTIEVSSHQNEGPNYLQNELCLTGDGIPMSQCSHSCRVSMRLQSCFAFEQCWVSSPSMRVRSLFSC